MCNVSGDFFIFQRDMQCTCTPGTRHCAISLAVNARFIPPDLWLLNSTDLNPVNYKIWGDIQQRVHQSQLNSIDELKKHLLDAWHVMDQSIIDDAIDGWHKHLRSHIWAKGIHGPTLDLKQACFLTIAQYPFLHSCAPSHQACRDGNSGCIFGAIQVGLRQLHYVWNVSF